MVRFFEQLRVRVYVTSEPRKKFSSPGMLDLYLILPMRRGTAWFDTKKPDDMELRASQETFVEDLDFAGIPWSYGGVPEARVFAERLGLIRKVG